MPEENISVVLIAHNEEKVIGRMMDGLISNYSDKILELIVVDDVSSDRTAAIVEERSKADGRVRLVRRNPPCGVGRAIKTGFKSVNPKAKYVLTMDSDFIESIKNVGSMINEIERGDCDGVIGSRFITGSRLTAYPMTKKIMNRLYHILVRLLFRIRQKDLTNNFKLYKAEIIKDLPWRSNGFSINAETGMLPVILGYKIKEVPVSWIGRNQGMGSSKFRLLSVGLDYISVIPYAIWILISRIFGKKGLGR